jgi:hypothetical protein
MRRLTFVLIVECATIITGCGREQGMFTQETIRKWQSRGAQVGWYDRDGNGTSPIFPRDMPVSAKLVYALPAFRFRSSQERIDLRNLPAPDVPFALILCETSISDDDLIELARFPTLTDLDLSDTRVSNAGIRPLKELKNLSSVRLLSTNVEASGIADLQAALPNCRISTGRLPFDEVKPVRNE